jgi:hypothetical protein
MRNMGWGMIAHCIAIALGVAMINMQISLRYLKPLQLCMGCRGK